MASVAEAGSTPLNLAAPVQSGNVLSSGFRVVQSSSGVKSGLDIRQINPSFAIDWLLSDVCLDSGGKATGDDPAFCKSKRNLAIGEDVHYIRKDPATGMALTGLPLLLGYAPRVVKIFDRYPNRDFSVATDIYDVYEADGSLLSATGTRNAVDNNSNFTFWGLQEGKTWAWQDGWVFFPVCALFNACPVNINGSSTSGSYAIASGTETAKGPVSASFTVWQKYDSYTYKSGKSLATMVSYHSNAKDAQDWVNRANQGKLAIEAFYFTREYGLTRYENWSSIPECQRLFPHLANSKCVSGNYESGCTGANATQAWSTNGSWTVRAGCEEATHVEKVSEPIHAFGAPVGNAQVTSRNLLQNGDFAAVNMDWWFVYGGIQRSVQATSQGNRYASIRCPQQGCLLGEHIYQDAPVSSVTQTYFGYPKASIQNGVLLRASQDGAVARVLSFVIKANGQHEIYSQTVQLGKTWSPVRFHFKKAFAPGDLYLRFALYPVTSGVTYDVDEAFLAALPD